MDDPNALDDHVDGELRALLSLDRPKSFFVYAGAGSGKTRSLVKVLDYARKAYGRRLRLAGQRIAVVTYTNAACDEIKKRLDFDPVVEVSTIHSFAWALLQGHDSDIREWVRRRLEREIELLEDKQRRGRTAKAAGERARRIRRNKARLERLEAVIRFVYSPTGDNRGRDALNHDDVINMVADFLMTKSALQSVLVGGFPFLLIDESQDTHAPLIDALLAVQAKYHSKFGVGLLGDTMQRIYGHGKVGLEDAIPEGWRRPTKVMNHRCPQRVVELINRVRADADRQTQRERRDAHGEPERVGVVRLFLVTLPNHNKRQSEEWVARRMAEITGDHKWDEQQARKTLILEHHMAARRMDFAELFEALYKVERYRTGLLSGELAPLGLFTKQVLPLIQANRRGDSFGVMTLVRRHSELISPVWLQEAGSRQLELVRKARAAVEDLLALWSDCTSPKIGTVLETIKRTGLFPVPDVLELEVAASEPAADDGEASNDTEDEAEEGWRRVLELPFSQIEQYESYVGGSSSFDTHQGVKGLEFPRVMVIIDDDARGFLFSYDKLFGAAKPTATDRKNVAEGKETSIDRTRRLFYVTCSRAEESLAIVAYSSDPEAVRASVLERGWFAEDEVEHLDG